MIPVRYQRDEPRVTRVFEEGGLAPGHALYGEPCPACDEPLLDQPIALVYIGPGSDPDDQQKARNGRWHTGAAVAVHKDCAGEP